MKTAPKKLTEEEIKTLARDMIKERVFTSMHIRDEQEAKRMLPMIFLPIGFGALDGVKTEELGMVYEYMHEAMPRSINGYPCFMSMRMVHKEQVEEIWDQYKQFRELLEE